MMNTTSASRPDIVDKLSTAFRKVTGQDPPATPLQESTRLRDDLGLDSFAALELIFELEDVLGVRIPNTAAVTFQTVGDVVTFAVAELSAPKPSAPITPDGGMAL